MNASLSEDEEEGEEQATAATITGRGATRRLAQWSAGTRREFSRKLSRRWDDNGNPIEAVHLRRVMGLFGILIGKLQLTGPPVLSFDRGRVSNTTWLVSRGDTGFFSTRLFFSKKLLVSFEIDRSDRLPFAFISTSLSSLRAQSSVED